jgi:hypothetical protein
LPHARLQSCYAGDGGVEYTAEAVWADSAEDAQALRSLLRAAAEEAEAPAVTTPCE